MAFKDITAAILSWYKVQQYSPANPNDTTDFLCRQYSHQPETVSALRLFDILQQSGIITYVEATEIIRAHFSNPLTASLDDAHRAMENELKILRGEQAAPKFPVHVTREFNLKCPQSDCPATFNNLQAFSQHVLQTQHFGVDRAGGAQPLQAHEVDETGQLQGHGQLQAHIQYQAHADAPSQAGGQAQSQNAPSQQSQAGNSGGSDNAVQVLAAMRAQAAIQAVSVPPAQAAAEALFDASKSESEGMHQAATEAVSVPPAQAATEALSDTTPSESDHKSDPSYAASSEPSSSTG